MGKKNSSARVAPNISTASSLAASATTKKSNTSSILRSAFSPSHFQLSLFASVIQSLDSQQLRVHDTATGRLRCEYTTSNAEITALDWGYSGSTYRLDGEQPSKKRRRRTDDTNGENKVSGDVVVAIGTSKSHIHLFSPTEAKVLATLAEGHSNGVRDFKFTNHGLGEEAWSLGGDGKLVQWSLRDQTILKTIASPDTGARILLPLYSSLLVASETVHQIDGSTGQVSKLGSSASPIQHLDINSHSKATSPTTYLTSSLDDNSIYIHNLFTSKITGSLVAETDVTFISRSEEGESPKILGAITKGGLVELFGEPFNFQSGSKGKPDIKSKRKNMVKKAVAKVQVTRPGKDNITVPITGITFQDNELVIAYAEGSAGVGFERLQWTDESHQDIIVSGLVDLKKAKTLVGVDGESTNGIKDMRRMQVDESGAVTKSGSKLDSDAMPVVGKETIDISSGVESSGEEDDEDDPQAMTNGVHDDVEMKDADSQEEVDKDQDGEGEGEDEDGEPSFGDLLRANTSGPIDVASAFPKDKQMVRYGQEGSKQVSSGGSLTTVLSQSLKTNDVTLLESCLHEQDLRIVRATIEKLDPTLAIKLLDKLAERLHSRPGRSGSLMVWVQWTLIAHGGFLASQPSVVQKLTSLQEIVTQRATGLQPLLSLKGKLDMLEAQMNLRRSMLHRSGNSGFNEDDEEAVVYVEGQEASDDSDESEITDDEDVEYSDDDEIPALNVDVDEVDSGEESDGGLIDDEASETDADSGEDLEDIDHDDVDLMDDESEEEVTAPTLKGKSRLTNGLGSKKR